MPETITPNSRIPFGQRGRFGSRGKRLRDCSDKLLRWLAVDMRDSDLAAWSVVAQTIIDGRERGERQFAAEDDLEAQADQFLINAGAGYLVSGRRKVRNPR